MLSRRVTHEPDPYISMVRISPFNLPDARRRYVMIRAYYDGGNKSHESGYLTLAGLSATDSLWPEFESRWDAVLDKHKLKWWHTTDAMTFEIGARRDFLKFEGAIWNPVLAKEAMDDLHAVITQFWEQQWRHGFQLFTCSIDLVAYREARDRNWLLRTAEAICVENCAGYMKLDSDGAALLYFDRGEEFMKEVEQVWRKDKKSPPVGWARQFKCITPVDSKGRPSRPSG